MAIDVKPSSERNPVQLRGHGVIPVAILGSAGFDGAGESDVVLHFRTEATGIECGDTTAGLTGLTFDGREFAGSDAIDVLGCGAIGRRFDFD